MHTSLSAALIFTTLLAAPLSAVAQFGSNNQCSPDATNAVQSCLAQVQNTDQSQSGGPCTSSDWNCLCNKQSAMVQCYAQCTSMEPSDFLNYNQNNCQGQNGININQGSFVNGNNNFPNGYNIDLNNNNGGGSYSNGIGQNVTHAVSTYNGIRYDHDGSMVLRASGSLLAFGFTVALFALF